MYTINIRKDTEEYAEHRTVEKDGPLCSQSSQWGRLKARQGFVTDFQRAVLIIILLKYSAQDNVRKPHSV